MINLVRNELYKIFHKKGIYVILIVIILYGLLTTYIYKADFLSNIDEFDSDIQEEYVKELQDEDMIKTDEYVSAKATLETLIFADRFGKNTWQEYVLKNDIDYNLQITDLYRNIVSYEVGMTKDKNLYEQSKNELETITNSLKEMSWRDYATKRRDEILKILESSDNSSTDNEYRVELEVIEMRLKYDIAYANDSRNDNLNVYKYNRIDVLDYENVDVKTLKEAEKKRLDEASANVEVSKYKIENDVEDIQTDSLGSIIVNFYSEYFIMIIVIIVLISGSIVSDEFSKGTIKLLLVRPHSRFKIFMSKFITTIIMIFFAIGSCFIIQMILGSLLLGLRSLRIPMIIYNYKMAVVEEISILKYFAYNTLAVLPQFILLSTLAFSLSTIFSNTGLASTLTIVGAFGSDIINLIAENLEIWFLKFFVTLNWDFSPYLFGGTSPYKGITLPFSIVVCIIYFAVMLVISMIVFQKRNVKNI